MTAGVLVVDDAELARITLRGLLRRAGYEVRVAGCLAEAWAELTDWLPQCIVVDHRLPDGDGLTFARELRAHPSLRGTRVVMLSGDLLAKDALSTADAVLLKPADAEAVLAAVAGMTAT